MITTTVTPAKVTYASATEVIAGATYKTADHNVPDGLAKDDWVAITTDSYTGVSTLTKVDAIEGKVDAVKGTDARVDGNWYAINGKGLTIGNSFKFYAVNGVVCAATATGGASISNLVMVLNKDTGTIERKVIILKADGTKATVTMDTSGVDPDKGGLYIYSETDDGYKFANAATIGTSYTWNAGIDAQVQDSANGATGTVDHLHETSGSNYAIADNAVIFVYGNTDSSGTVITGKQLKQITIKDGAFNDTFINDDNSATAQRGFYVSTTNGLDRVSYAAVATSKVSELSVTSGNINYAYVTSDGYNVSIDGKTYETYTIWNGTDNLTVNELGTPSHAKGDIITYDAIDASANNKITGVNKLTITNTGTNTGYAISEVGAIRGMEGQTIYLDGVATTNALKRTSDTKYLYVDTSASGEDIGIASGEVVLANKNATVSLTDYWRDNVIAVTNASDEVLLLVVDVKNDYTCAANKTLGIASSTLTSANGYTLTLSIGASSATNVAKLGDLITLTVKNGTGTEKAGGTHINLTTGVAEYGTNATGANAITLPTLAAGASATYTLVVTADSIAITEAT